ncbi:DASH family cryptochrome [Halomonas koreensis]|uniref:Cryptochrome DASH n=1 Tax=Halomonas koreensis TaxID=245385 RepID=A0ABU1G291_9GAMM|nr:DASH family cryptochrome [Halomonas koreensis]MDR5866592.1 DASH family cryptochrome [Halomonas koreensis]
MSIDVIWLRQDLRLADNPLLGEGLGQQLLCLYVLDRRWLDEARIGPARLGFLWQSLIALRGELLKRGSDLLVRLGDPAEEVARLAEMLGADRVRVRRDPGWEERAAVSRLRRRLEAVCPVEEREGGMLLGREHLPTAVEALPASFSAFRRRLAEASPPPAAPAPLTLPPWPSGAPRGLPALGRICPRAAGWQASPRGDFGFTGGEEAGAARLADYLWHGGAVAHYARTRNGLAGADFSSRLSPWLAMGCLSARRVNDALRAWEAEHGESDSSRWLRFELLWRDYFHWAAWQDGPRLFGARPWPDPGEAFAAWTRGETGVPLVDAGMRELAATGWLSNRARQNVASYWLHDLGGDWRLGAGWFERCLIDHDAASNWGNWAYLAGQGRHERPRRFAVLRQAEHYDPRGEYVARWQPALAALPPGHDRHRPWRAAPEAFPAPLAAAEPDADVGASP